MATQADQQQDSYKLTPDQQHIFNRAMWIVIGVGVGWVLFADKEGYATNVFTEILGVVGTFFVLDYWVRQRDQRQRVEELEARLLREVCSPEPAIVRHAIYEMGDRGMLGGKNSLLQGEDLSYSNMSRAKLRAANLYKTDFFKAVLVDSDLSFAMLKGANLEQGNLNMANLNHAMLNHAILVGANLSKAILAGAFIVGADLTDAIMVKANLLEANLKGTNLLNSNLREANLQDALFDEQTILPDGSKYNPELGHEQLFRFTDPYHTEFWQPD